MPHSPGTDITSLLRDWAGGDRHALDQLMPLVYAELRRIAHLQLRRRPEATLATTALVNEAYLRLVDQNRVRLETRLHFLNLAALVMRRVVVDDARRRGAGKRGSGTPKVSLDEVPEPGAAPGRDILALDDALTRLESLDPRLSRVVELRYFGGLNHKETAEILGGSTTAAWRDWNTARAWLFNELKGS